MDAFVRHDHSFKWTEHFMTEPYAYTLFLGARKYMLEELSYFKFLDLRREVSVNHCQSSLQMLPGEYLIGLAISLIPRVKAFFGNTLR